MGRMPTTCSQPIRVYLRSIAKAKRIRRRMEWSSYALAIDKALDALEREMKRQHPVAPESETSGLPETGRDASTRDSAPTPSGDSLAANGTEARGNPAAERRVIR